MITAEQVKNLNKKIEQLNVQGNRAKAKLEVLEGNLHQSLEDYAAVYGVNLGGATMKATAANIQKELQSVEAAIQAEVELREKVVSAIERGDIDEANRLLGVEVVEEAEEEPEEAVEEVVNNSSKGDNLAVSGMSVSADTDEDDKAEVFGFSGLDLDDFSIDDEEPASATPKSSKSSGKKNPSMGTPAADVVEDMEGGFGDFDLSEDEFEDFGFGSMLSGTKFSLDD